MNNLCEIDVKKKERNNNIAKTARY